MITVKPKMRALEFIQPKRPSIETDDLVFPQDCYHPHLIAREALYSLGRSPSMWRNVVALYLRAAQVPVKDIAVFLSITPSRTSAVIALARKRIYAHRSGRRTAPFDRTGKAFSENEIAAHYLRMDGEEMKAAEAALDAMLIGSGGRIHVISAALTLGRNSFLQAQESLQGVKCPCLRCASVSTHDWQLNR